MKKYLIGFVSSILVLGLSACSTAPNSSVSSENSKENLQIIAKVKAPEGSLAGASLDPSEYLESRFEDSVIGAVKGQISDVEYTSLELIAGTDEPFSISLAQTIMTIKVQGSTFGASGEIKVATSGGYLSPTVEGIYGRPEGDLGSVGVIEYETAGGSEPPVIGQTVILFLQDSGKALARVAPYTVTGSSFGRFTLDESSGVYSRKLEGPGNVANFTEFELVGDALETR
jgi:hypothetical protein